MLLLEVHPRTIFGKKLSKSRSTGLIPAILYGKKVGDPLPLFVQEAKFQKVFKEAGESTVIHLQVSDDHAKEFPVLIYKIERDPLRLRPIHIDFFQLPMDEKIKVTVPLVFDGHAPALDLGGTLVRNIQEVEVRAMPVQLPREILVDCSVLTTFEDVIRIQDMRLKEGVEIVGHEADEVVAQVLPVVQEKIAEELAVPLEEKIEEVEVIKKEKPPEAPPLESSPPS